MSKSQCRHSGAGLIFAVWVFASVFWNAESVSACSLDPEVTARDRLAGSKAAFIGTLLSSQPMKNPSIPELGERIYRFRVDKAIKGALGEEVGVRFGSDFAACTGEFSSEGPVGILLFESEDGVWRSDVSGLILPNDLEEASGVSATALSRTPTAPSPQPSFRASASEADPAQASAVERSHQGSRIPLWAILLAGVLAFGPAIAVLAKETTR